MPTGPKLPWILMAVGGAIAASLFLALFTFRFGDDQGASPLDAEGIQEAMRRDFRQTLRRSPVAVVPTVVPTPSPTPRPAPSPTPRPAPSPTLVPTRLPTSTPIPALSEEIANEAAAAAQQAFDVTFRGTGHVAYNPVVNMKVGIPEQVEVAIAAAEQLTAQVEDALRSSLPKGLTARVEQLAVASVMRLTLDGGDAFDVRPANSRDKALLPTGETTVWHWTVLPQKAGRHPLTLCAESVVETPDGDRLPGPGGCPYRTTIDVAVNPPYSARRFVANNLEWFVTPPSGGLLTVLAVAWWQRRRQGKSGAPRRRASRRRR